MEINEKDQEEIQDASIKQGGKHHSQCFLLPMSGQEVCVATNFITVKASGAISTMESQQDKLVAANANASASEAPTAAQASESAHKQKPF